KNADTINRKTISELAKETHFSSSFISKLVKKIGYDSFAAMRLDLKNDLVKKIESNEYGVLKNQNIDIAKTNSLLLQMNFKPINKLFDTATAIYVYGTGHSQNNYMRELSRNLMALVNVPVIFLSGQSEFQSVIYTAKSTSCFIIASTTGKTPVLIDAVKILNLSQVPIISFTSFSDNELSDLATYNLFYYLTPIKNPTNHRNIRSYLPLGYVVDFVISLYKGFT
ncbi:MAG: MurR/RpiR family transcriptional regulator, partial [Veillonella sp.]